MLALLIVFQVSSLVLEQQERLIQQDTALVNLTQWQRKYTLEYCQALLQRSLHSGNWQMVGLLCLSYSLSWLELTMAAFLCVTLLPQHPGMDSQETSCSAKNT